MPRAVTNLMKCRHDFKPTPRAKTPSKMLPGELLPARCVLCKTKYPCAHHCEHVDCCIETGRPLPEFVQEVASVDEVLSRLGARRVA